MKNTKTKFIAPKKGSNKDEARKLMVNAIVNKWGTILTLPFETAIIEEMIYNQLSKKINFIGYECDKAVFFKLCALVGRKELPISPIYGLISEAIYTAKANQFSNLILDYCGVLDTFAAEIKYAVTNNIVAVNGIMAVTLSKMGIRNNVGVIGDLFKVIDKSMFAANICETELGVKLFFSKILDTNYKVETVFNYSDSKNGKKGMDMILVIIRRIA